MLRRRLGRSELDVSVISLGCWALAGDSTWGEQDKAASISTVHAALDTGINFFDTAEMYGNGRSEEVLGEALRGIRDEVFIASKVTSSNLRPADLKRACEQSLRRLRTDYIDVYYIHWPNPDIPVDETLDALQRLKQEGKIRVAACSNFGPRDLSELLEHGRVEANQLAYNLLFRAIEYEIQPLCQAQEVGVVCYSPLAQGLLTGKFRSADEVPAGRARTRHFSPKRPGVRHDEEGVEEELFATLAEIRRICDHHGMEMDQAGLAWLLEQPGVCTIVAGARTPEQVRRNALSAQLSMPVEVVDELATVTEPLKKKLGPNADMWQTDSRIK